MQDKKYQIFVSSTYQDLVEARDKIIETVLSLYHFPVGMEMFSADDSEQWEIVQETINVSDYYVIIIGHRYGSVTAEGISFTEKEYDYAKEKGLPILAFIRNRNVPTQPQERESTPEAARQLDAFIEKATSSKMCDFWDNIDDLATKVAIALPKIFRRNPQIGWIRGSEAISKEISQELAELSTENRELREKLKTLESLISENKPLIRVNINSSGSMAIGYAGMNPNNLLELPKPLSIESIPSHLKEFIDSNEIKKYNNKLPSQQDIDNYNDALQFYYMATNEAIKPSFDVSNVGHAKANDIFITLCFPNFVRVIEEWDIKKISPPENPTPSSPLVKAQTEYDKRQPWPSLYLSTLLNFSSNIEHHHAFHNSLNLNSLRGPNINFWSSVKENVVTLKLNSLIHTRMKSFNEDIMLIPLEAGEGEIEVTVICEEYKIQDFFVIPISVAQKEL
jgi:hypothetical protein